MEGQSNCRTLEELLDSLDPDLFWRAHRSYLVNINRIKEVVPGSRVLINCAWTTKSRRKSRSAAPKPKDYESCLDCEEL